MKKDAGIFLKHILESIKRIEEFTEGISKEDFFNSVQIQDAVLRRLEIIGEATKNLPQEFKRNTPRCPGVKWREPEISSSIVILV